MWLFIILVKMVRTRIEIYEEMLELTKVETKKTHLVYGCNLNFNTVKKYLKHLLDKGQIKEIILRDKTYYVTTNKGLNTLKTLKTLV